MNEKIGLKDIIGLAIKGYKPGDIKEILELAERAQQIEEQEETTELVDQTVDDTPEQDQETDNDDKMDPDSLETESELKKEIEALNAKIKKLQEENTQKDLENEPITDQQKFEELVKDFF